MRTITRVAGTAAVILSLGLAACGGGGGGSSVPAGGGGNSGGSSNVVTPLTHAQERATMQSSVSAVQTLSQSSGELSISRHALAMHRGRHTASTAGCVNGQTSVDTTNVTAGTETETDTTYYDALCTEPEEVDVVTVPTSATDTSFTATGTVTDYSIADAVTSYETLSIAFNETSSTQSTFTIEATQSATVGGAVTAQIGTTCTDTQGASSETIACGAADVQTSGGTQTGASVSENGTVGSTALSVTLSASAYSAASGLGIAQGASPAWNVTGGSPIDTISGTFISTSSAGTTISLSDSSTGITISGTIAAGVISLTESQSGKTLATATITSATGNGTIAYADGTNSTIVDWTVQG